MISRPQDRFIRYIDRNLKFWLSFPLTTKETNNIIQAIKFGFKVPSQRFHETAAALIIQSYPLFDKTGNYRQILSIIQECPSDIQISTWLNLNNLYGICEWKLGNIPQAEKHFIDTKNLATGIHFTSQLADSYYGKCLCAISRADLPLAENMAHQAIRLYISQKRAIPIVLTQIALATTNLLQGNLNKSEVFIQKSLDILAALPENTEQLEDKLSVNLGVVKITHSHTREGIRLLGEAAQNVYQRDDITALLQIEINRAYQYLRLNKPVEARAALQRGFTLYQSLPVPNYQLEPLLKKLASQLDSQT